MKIEPTGGTFWIKYNVSYKGKEYIVDIKLIFSSDLILKIGEILLPSEAQSLFPTQQNYIKQKIKRKFSNYNMKFVFEMNKKPKPKKRKKEKMNASVCYKK